MCIYLGDGENLTYNGQEHIFPASLGGKKMLPKGYVSDQANNYFSAIEGDITHNSLIAGGRMLYGPGKRGGDKPSEKPILIFSSNKDFSMGYVHLMKINIIPHLYVKGTDVKICAGEREGEIFFSKFITDMQKFDGKYVSITHKNLSEGEFLIGYSRKHFYIGTGERYPPPDKNVIKTIVNNIVSEALKHKTDAAKSEVISNPEFQWIFDLKPEEMLRIYAKTAMNLLASEMGEAYVLSSEFDTIRKFILRDYHSDEIEYFEYVEELSNLIMPHPPSKSHLCIIFSDQEDICAIVSFYCLKPHLIVLGHKPQKQSNEKHNNMPIIMICDHKNKQEYNLLEWISINRKQPEIS